MRRPSTRQKVSSASVMSTLSRVRFFISRKNLGPSITQSRITMSLLYQMAERDSGAKRQFSTRQRSTCQRGYLPKNSQWLSSRSLQCFMADSPSVTVMCSRRAPWTSKSGRSPPKDLFLISCIANQFVFHPAGSADAYKIKYSSEVQFYAHGYPVAHEAKARCEYDR